jgi:flagellar biosynthesis chaperone FliJ
MRWPLQVLLELRRRDAEAAERALGRALDRCRAAEAEALAARGAAACGWEAMRQPSPTHQAARLDREAGRLHVRAVEADQRCWAEAAAVERCLTAVRSAVARREALRRLRAGWLEERAREAARRAEAALDDQPWPGRNRGSTTTSSAG